MNEIRNTIKTLVLFVCILTFAGCSKVSSEISIPDQVVQNKKLSSLVDICPSELFTSIQTKYSDLTEICTVSESKCLTRCHRGEASACFGLANVYVKIDQNKEASQLLFKRSCELGLHSGCTNAAAGMLNNQETLNGDCLLNTFEGSCERKDPWGCTMQAIMLSDKRYIDVVERNFDKALVALRGSCKHGIEDPACSGAKELEVLIKEAMGK